MRCCSSRYRGAARLLCCGAPLPDVCACVHRMRHHSHQRSSQSCVLTLPSSSPPCDHSGGQPRDQRRAVVPN